MRVVVKKILKLIGPISLAALSVLSVFLLLQPLACWLDPTFNLLASRGIGKVAFIFLIIYQIFLLLLLLPQKFFNQFLNINIFFFKDKNWIKSFFIYFVIFFSLHICLLISLYLFGYIKYNPEWGNLCSSLILKTIFGFFVTFMLAWTEELIFRGTIYLYLVQYIKPITSIFLTSAIFMFAHDLYNPLNLITKNWQLGLGLFLLGFLLNTIFVTTNKLYTGMGAHAGLVFVKVLLRRMPIITFLPASILPFWVTKDLRMSFVVHILFLITILIYIYKDKSKILKS